MALNKELGTAKFQAVRFLHDLERVIVLKGKPDSLLLYSSYDAILITYKQKWEVQRDPEDLETAKEIRSMGKRIASVNSSDLMIRKSAPLDEEQFFFATWREIRI